MIMTAFTQGTGTSADPFIITTGEQCAEFFNRMEEAIYCSLAADVDLKAWPHKTGLYQRATLNGNGYAIKNYGSNLAAGTGTGLFPGGNSYSEKPPGKIIKTEFIDINISNVSYLTRNAGNAVLENCYFHFSDRSTAKTLLPNGDVADNEGQSNVINCCFYPGINVGIKEPDLSSIFMKSSCYFITTKSQLCAFYWAKNVTPNSIASETYTALDKAIWSTDENNIARLLNSNRAVYEFSGVTSIDGAAKSRDVYLIHYDASVAFLRNKKTVSNSAGQFSVQTLSDDPMTVIAQDNPGYKLELNRSYILGEYVRPTTANGYRYKCTTAGNSGSVMPPSSWPTSTPITIGTAIFTAEKLAEAVCYGPVTPVPVGTVKPNNLVLNYGYAIGVYVQPITPVGYRWRCTKQGMTGSVYPPEPWSTSSVMQVGAAQFTPEPIPA